MGVGFSWRPKEGRERKRAKFFLVFVLVVSARSKESGGKFFLVVSSKRRKGEGALLNEEDLKHFFGLV